MLVLAILFNLLPFSNMSHASSSIVPDRALEEKLKTLIKSQNPSYSEDFEITKDMLRDLEFKERINIGVVFGFTKEVQGLCLDGKVKNLEGLQYCDNLEALEYRSDFNNEVVRDLSPLRDLKNLKSLRILSEVRDLYPLSELTNLEALSITSRGVGVDDISPLKNLTNLKYLEISGKNGRIYDYSPLSNLINLKSLTIDIRLNSDISPIKNLVGLEELFLESGDDRLGESVFLYGDEPRFSDVTEFASYKTLKRFGLPYTSTVPKNIEKMTDLEYFTGSDLLDLSTAPKSMTDTKFKARGGTMIMQGGTSVPNPAKDIYGNPIELKNLPRSAIVYDKSTNTITAKDFNATMPFKDSGDSLYFLVKSKKSSKSQDDFCIESIDASIDWQGIDRVFVVEEMLSNKYGQEFSHWEASHPDIVIADKYSPKTTISAPSSLKGNHFITAVAKVPSRLRLKNTVSDPANPYKNDVVSISVSDIPAGKRFHKWQVSGGIGVNIANLYSDPTAIVADGEDFVDIEPLFIAEATTSVSLRGFNIIQPPTLIEKGVHRIIDINYEPYNATNKNVKNWTSSDESVAVVKDGIVTAKKTGQTTISVWSEELNTTTSCILNVNIVEKKPSVPNLPSETDDDKKDEDKKPEDKARPSSSGGGGGSSSKPKKKDDVKKDEKKDTTTQENIDNNDINRDKYQDIVDISDFYSDVPKDAWYVEPVEFVTKKGLMVGTGDGRFEPETKLTRAMFASVLYKLADKPISIDSNLPFTDVDGKAWYLDAVNWAFNNKVTSGISKDKFGPEMQITREQLVAMLYNYVKITDKYKNIAQYNQEDISLYKTYTDFDKVSDFAVDSVKWAIDKGIIKGRDDKSIAPNAVCTRAEVATILMNFINISSQK